MDIQLMPRPSAARGPIALPKWQRRAVYTSTAVLMLTGAAWLVIYCLAPDPYEIVPGTFAWQQAQLWLIRLHAAATLVACVVVGSLLTLHMAGAWQRRRNRISGAAAVAVFCLLALTGYALWYAPQGGLRQWSAWLHWGIGLAMPAGLWLHVRKGRQSR